MYNDLNDTGIIPEDANNEIITFPTEKMLWMLKSINDSQSSAASVVFSLTKYDGIELLPSSNIELTVIPFNLN